MVPAAIQKDTPEILSRRTRKDIGEGKSTDTERQGRSEINWSCLNTRLSDREIGMKALVFARNGEDKGLFLLPVEIKTADWSALKFLEGYFNPRLDYLQYNMPGYVRK